MLNQAQRIVSFYILYELYHHDKVTGTPFEAVVLSSIHHLSQKSSSLPLESKPELKLLTDFLVSVPRINKSKIETFIQECEASQEPI